MTRKRDGSSYLTVSEVADHLRMSPRSVWRKLLKPPDGSPPLLPYYDLHGIVRIAAADFQAFLDRHFHSRTPDS